MFFGRYFYTTYIYYCCALNAKLLRSMLAREREHEHTTCATLPCQGQGLDAPPRRHILPLPPPASRLLRPVLAHIYLRDTLLSKHYTPHTYARTRAATHTAATHETRQELNT
jgi:hypothetical protein